MQALEPLVSLNFPASHRTHRPPSGPVYPRAQRQGRWGAETLTMHEAEGEHETLPGWASSPSAQGMHLPGPALGLKVSSGQSAHAAAPASLLLPLAHGKRSPRPGQKKPGVHEKHEWLEDKGAVE